MIIRSPLLSPGALTLTLVAVLLLVQGCAPLTHHYAVPLALQERAEVPGFAGVRYRMGTDSTTMLREGMEALQREQASLAAQSYSGALPPAVYLAISGGGDNGAFTASRDPKALDLFQTLMVASAAIPGAFPPVLINVEADYDEQDVFFDVPMSGFPTGASFTF